MLNASTVEDSEPTVAVGEQFNYIDYLYWESAAPTSQIFSYNMQRFHSGFQFCDIDGEQITPQQQNTVECRGMIQWCHHNTENGRT